MRLGYARMWDNLRCVNFAGGEVCHLITFSKSSLDERGETTLLKRRAVGMRSKFQRVEGRGRAVRYLSQNFPPAVALPSGRVGDDPSHLWRSAALLRSLPPRLAGPLRWFAHAAAVSLLEDGAFMYFHWRTDSLPAYRMHPREALCKLLYPLSLPPCALPVSLPFPPHLPNSFSLSVSLTHTHYRTHTLSLSISNVIVGNGSRRSDFYRFPTRQRDCPLMVTQM